MTTNPHKELALRALSNMRGDDLARARMAFRNYTPYQMQEQHGESGKTRAQIIAEYEAWDAEITDAVNWLNTK